MNSGRWIKSFRSLVGQFKNSRSALQQLRQDLGPRDPRQIFLELSQHPMFVSAVSIRRSPRRFSDLWATKRLASCGLISDLTWLGEVVALFVDELKGFLKIEQEFEAAYIQGDLPRSITALNDLEEGNGLSLWLISRKTTVFRRSGIPQYAEYTNSLIATGHNNSIISWLVYMMWFRSDPNVTPAAYTRLLRNSLDPSAVPDRSKAFLRYHASSEPPRTLDDCASVISISETASIIDRYIALIDVLQFIACSTVNGSAEREAATAIVDRLKPIVGDARLTVLAEVLGEPKISDLMARLDLQSADAYTEGNYSEAGRLIASAIVADPGRTGLYSLLARTYLRTSERFSLPANVAEIVDQIASVYTFAENDEAAASDLMRESVLGAHRSLACSIRAVFSVRGSDPSTINVDSAVETLNGNRLTPLQLRSLPIASCASLLSACAAAFPESTSVALQQAVSRFGEVELDRKLVNRLPRDRASLYQARALLRLSRFNDAISFLREFEDAPVASIANDARRELFAAYSAAGQTNNALKVVAHAHLVNEKLHAIFELKPLLDRIESDFQQAPFDQVSLSICYHIHNRFSSDLRLGAQADAAEEYALSRNATLPSRIELSSLLDDQMLIPIYLDQVCSPQVLDKFMAIDDVNQVELERLEICRILSEIDPVNRQRYLEEIREITRRRVVRDRFKQVERTKIYVDTDGVKRQAEKTLRDAFSRFIVALADTTQGNERLEMVRRVQSIIADVESDGIKIHFPDLPASERDLLFDRIVRDLMRLLISSQEYGLEAYLSTRVRHGTMGNQLRSAFEINSILTQKDGERYQRGEAWAETMDLVYDPRGPWLSERLARFSEDVDSTIEELVRRRVQVRSESTPDGLFAFHTYNYDTIKLQAEITTDTDFDTFMDKVIERFWIVLEGSLSAVRRHIEGEFLQTILALTDTLQLDLIRDLAGVNSSPLSGAIATARTQMAVNVGNVASWFTLARDMERPDYEFGIAVEVATESIRVCHPSLGITLHRTDDVSFECRGRSLESLVYVLFTALDNAIEHSHFAERSPDLTLETSLSDGWLNLTLHNSCAPVEGFEASNAGLVALRARLENATDLQSLATTEGGSGYAKIIRILRHDLLARYSLEFGYQSPIEYVVKIGVEARAIVK